MTGPLESPLNTVYIISKGRPRCTTARTLVDLDFPGEWFIVCGNNDETLPEYRRNWGERVLVFDWHEEIETTETMDDLGFEAMASGAVPVRNATARISRERGERRHWQFDDDYDSFHLLDASEMRNRRITDGRVLYDRMLQIAEWADRCGMANAGFALSTMEGCPDKALAGCIKRIFNAHNMASEGPLFTRWRGQMNDDLINALDTWRTGGCEFAVKYMQLHMEPSQQEAGGLTDLYEAEGTVRKTAYAVLANPQAVKLVKEFGRYHHRVNWGRVVPKLVSDRYRKH